jgi:hypothetical protein
LVGTPSKLKSLDEVDVPLAPVTVAPGGVFNPQVEQDLTNFADVIPALKDGRAIINVAIRAEYHDAFDRIWVLDAKMRNYPSFLGDHWIMHPTETGNGERQKR